MTTNTMTETHLKVEMEKSYLKAFELANKIMPNLKPSIDEDGEEFHHLQKYIDIRKSHLEIFPEKFLTHVCELEILIRFLNDSLHMAVIHSDVLKRSLQRRICRLKDNFDELFLPILEDDSDFFEDDDLDSFEEDDSDSFEDDDLDSFEEVVLQNTSWKSVKPAFWGCSLN